MLYSESNDTYFQLMGCIGMLLTIHFRACFQKLMKIYQQLSFFFASVEFEPIFEQRNLFSKKVDYLYRFFRLKIQQKDSFSLELQIYAEIYQ